MTDRLLTLLSEQIDFLEASCSRYDEGAEHEAKRIALSVRVLVHDTDSSKSLLGLLGVKDTLEFVDTAQSMQMTPTFHQPVGFVVPDMERGQEHYKPILDDFGRYRSSRFDKWWETVLIRPLDHKVREKTKGRASFSRRDFILGAANQEGGAHVGPSPRLWWCDLLSQDYLGALKTQSGVPISGLIPASIRQIGFEVVETLKRLATKSN